MPKYPYNIDCNDDGNIANEIYELWSKYCFFGYRKITAVLNKRIGYRVNHKRVYKLMKEMRLKAVYAKPRTTIISKKHNKYPYLLKDLIINQLHQVWVIDEKVPGTSVPGTFVKIVLFLIFRPAGAMPGKFFSVKL